MKSYIPGEIPVREMHSLLLGAVAPRPIAFVSTIDKEDHPNLSPFSFFNMFGTNPPIFIFSPSRRGRDNTTKHTYQNVKDVPEVVINLVNINMVQQMNLASAEFPKGVNEFVKAGFTQLKSDIVKPYRVMESPVQIECRVLQVIETGSEGAAGNLVICEGLKVHVSEDILNENGRIDQRKAGWIARMGENWYCHATGNALFEVSKPLEVPAVGIDALPYSVRNSKILTGNDLGMMGNIPELPDPETIKQHKTNEKYLRIIQSTADPDKRRALLHEYARELLADGDVAGAISVCMD